MHRWTLPFFCGFAVAIVVMALWVRAADDAYWSVQEDSARLDVANGLVCSYSGDVAKANSWNDEMDRIQHWHTLVGHYESKEIAEMRLNAKLLAVRLRREKATLALLTFGLVRAD